MAQLYGLADMRLTTITLTVGDQKLTVYHATKVREWQQGLLGHNLRDVDGMLFTFSGDVRNQFHMRGMCIPVLLAFFDSAGNFIDLSFRPVGAEPYEPGQRYRYALELVGRHADVDGAVDLLPGLFAGIDP
jgi:uncharacterized membrane protein (UPF0127 family)